MTRNEQRLEKAKRLYPVGTKFTSLFGDFDIVTDNAFLKSHGSIPYYLWEYNGNILVQGQFGWRMVYSNGKWTKTHKNNES